jgi:3-methyladenine DNA glycosylase/8-oxoguanine DNA glycosylase
VPPVVLRRTRVPLPLDAAGADAETTIPLTVTLDLPRTLSPVAHGHGDPTIRIGAHEAWRAWRTTDGPATLRVRIGGGVMEARGWGPGAGAAVEAAGRLIGLADAPEAFLPTNRLLADLVHRFPGLRLPASGSVMGALVPAILEQKVTGIEARRTWRALLREHGEPAPGPAGAAGMRVLPGNDVLARIPSFTWHRLGIERRRASLVGRVARLGDRLEADPPERATARLRAIPGIGPWTMAEVARVAWGDPDAVSVGDFHLPSLVAWALAGEPRADDARMLELLAPFAGQRGRVQRLLEVSGIGMPRRGPRMTPGDIRAI